MNIFRSIFSFFYEIFFGCSHEGLTRPFTLDQHTYKVCLDCGAQIYYSADAMRPLRAREIRRMKALHAGEVKVVSSSFGTPVLMPANGNRRDAA